MTVLREKPPTPIFTTQNLKLRLLRLYFMLGSRVLPECAAAHAAKLFLTPYCESRKQAKEAFHKSNAMHKDIVVNGKKVAVYMWGNPWKQTYVLLAHGWSGYGLCFTPWIERLRALGHAVVTFDQPGHGLSEGKRCSLPMFVSTLREIGRRLGRPSIAIGHSLGAAALIMAHDEEWSAGKIILISPAIDLNDAIDRFAHKIHVFGQSREYLHAALRGRTKLGFLDLQLRWHVRRFKQPGLIMHDLEDQMVPWREGERYARHWAGAQLMTTKGLGHLRIVNDDRVMDAAVAFLQGEKVGTQLRSGGGNFLAQRRGDSAVTRAIYCIHAAAQRRKSVKN